MRTKITLMFVIMMANLAFGQNMVKLKPKLFPKQDTLCYGETIYMYIPGNSFQPISYLWSDGSTGSTIAANSSGLYELTVTGYLGNSSRIVTLNLSKDYDVLPKPTVDASTPLWVCKLDTVNLSVSGGYDSYVWRTGHVGNDLQKVFSNLGGGAVLDTMSIWYEALNTTGSHTCSAFSDTVVIRGVRFPEALTPRYCNSTGLSLVDSVKTGLVLTYIYEPSYEVEFTESSNTSNVYTYTTVPGSRMVPLSGLQVGSTYLVRTRGVINGIPYCWGSTCTIEITSSSRFWDMSLNERGVEKTFRVFDLSGRFVFERQGVKFNQEWLVGMPQQIYAVVGIYENEILTRELVSSMVLR